MTARIRITNVLLGFLFFGAESRSDVLGTGVVFDKRDDGMRTIFEVGAAVATPVGLQRAYKEISEAERSKLTFLSISAFRNSEDAALMLSGKGRTEITFDEAVKALRDAQKRGPLPMLRLVSIGADTVIQETDGVKISRRLLRGKDPTVFEVGRVRCDLLEVYFHRLPRPIRNDGQNPLLLKIYLKTNRLPTIREARTITRVLQDTFHKRNICLNIRTDTWFLQDDAFPFWYPFAPDRTPPTFEEYKARGQMFCVADESRMRCNLVGIPDK